MQNQLSASEAHQALAVPASLDHVRARVPTSWESPIRRARREAGARAKIGTSSSCSAVPKEPPNSKRTRLMNA